MARIPFDIKFRPQIESGEYKVETKRGDPIRILAWDLPYDFPIATAEFTEDKRVIVESYSTDGWVGYGEKENNLVIITPEPELSEWQTIISGCLQKYGLLDCGAADRIAKECSSELFDLTRKELTCQGNIVLSIEGFEKFYIEAQEKGRKEALKDLPRWRKCAETDCDKSTVPPWIVRFDAEKNTESAIVHQGYFLVFSDLEKLPKED